MGQQSAIEAEDRFTLLAGVVICVLIVTVLFSVGYNPLRPRYHLNNILVYASAWIFILGIYLILCLAKLRPQSPIAYVRTDFFDQKRRTDAKRALLYSLLLAIFGTLFSLSKKSIYLFNDYSWDATFIAWDRAIHGTDAWQFIQPFVGIPIITWAIGWCYQVWVLLIYIGNFYFIFFESDARARARFVFAYMITWTLIGFVSATLFASVGPCFLDSILGNDHFAPLMAYLHSVDAQYPIPMLKIQQNLLDWYFDDTSTLGAGISAMPSMHVAQAFLVFLAMLSKPKWAAAGFGLFALVILIGSVHLGLHYAVDGYVSIVLTALIWFATGALFRKMQLRNERSATPPAGVLIPQEADS